MPLPLSILRALLLAVHNLVVHPVMEICHWLGFIAPPVRRFGQWLHDITVPSDPGRD